jgi:hypothetical protein
VDQRFEANQQDTTKAGLETGPNSPADIARIGPLRGTRCHGCPSEHIRHGVPEE